MKAKPFIIGAILLTGAFTAAMTIPSPMKDTTTQIDNATQDQASPVTPVATPTSTISDLVTPDVTPPTPVTTPLAKPHPTPTPIGTEVAPNQIYIGPDDQPSKVVVHPTPFPKQ